MKKKLFGVIICCMVATMVSAQGNARSESYVYVTIEDFINDNRLYEGEYAVAPAKGEGRYKEPEKMVYTPERVDGNKRDDVSKEAWGVVSDGELYVNNRALNDGKGFSKSFATGRYNLFFVLVKESAASRKKYDYAKDDVRFYTKEHGKSVGTINVGGVGIGLGGGKLVFIPAVIDRTTGEMAAYSQAYMEKLASRHQGIAPVAMKEARGEKLTGYFRQLNAL